VTSFNAFGFLQLATAYTRKRMYTKNTLKDVFLAKYVPFGDANDENYYLNT